MSNTTNACTGTGKQGAYAYGTPNGHAVCPDCGRIIKAYPGGKVRSHKPAEQPVKVGVHEVTIAEHDKDESGKRGFQPVCSCHWTGAILRTRAGGVQPRVRAEHWGARHTSEATAADALAAEVDDLLGRTA